MTTVKVKIHITHGTTTHNVDTVVELEDANTSDSVKEHVTKFKNDIVDTLLEYDCVVLEDDKDCTYIIRLNGESAIVSVDWDYK